tara:strand:+ start:333 stop:1010 length:678 start_codon:yes stop_codon:yes gene_type:complete
MTEPLSPYEEKKWDEHKRMLDSQTNRVKIFESPDGGKTVFERYFGETKRRQIKPEPEQINEDGTVPPGYPAKSSAEVEMHDSEEDKKSAFVQYGKDEHEVYLTEDAFGQIISTQNDEPMEVITANLVDFEDADATINDDLSEEELIAEEEKYMLEKGMVDHPPHYNKGIETSNYIRSWEMNWDQANIIKYVTRYNLKHVDKDLQCQDLRKARHYLDRLIESYEDK